MCIRDSPLTVAEKSSVQIGHAVFVYENCVVNTDGVESVSYTHLERENESALLEGFKNG